MLALGLMAAGLPGRLLAPGALGRAVRRPRPRPRGRADRGLALRRPGSVDPAHRAAWGAALLTVGAVLAFWPARRGTARAPSGGALGAAAHVRHRGDRTRSRRSRRCAGWSCSCSVAAWLWLPRLPRARPFWRGVVVASVGVLSLPVAAALDSNRAWWDYHGVRWFGNGKVITFDWNHTYGPLELVARGRDAAEREVGPPAVLEGRDARRLRRLPLDSHERPERHAVRHAGRLHGAPHRGQAGTTASTTSTGTSASA